MRNRGFTLLEVVLAIGLTGAVLAILTTAIELFVLRVDTSRSRVESAQLARTLLKGIADDLQAARYYAPPSSSPGGAPPESSNSRATNSVGTRGIFGDETELRIDRSAPWSWERRTRDLDLDATTRPDEMPQTARYFLREGNELLAGKLAAMGVTDTPLPTDFAGLYCGQSVSEVEETTSESFSGFQEQQTAAELLAPEVVEIRFRYFDGEQLLEQWDSSINEGLPRAVEIRLKLLEEPFETIVARQRNGRQRLREEEENLKEYRLLVQLPHVLPARQVKTSRAPEPPGQ